MRFILVPVETKACVYQRGEREGNVSQNDGFRREREGKKSDPFVLRTKRVEQLHRLTANPCFACKSLCLYVAVLLLFTSENIISE